MDSGSSLPGPGTPVLVPSGLLLHLSPHPLSAQTCLGESPLATRTVSLSAGLAVSEVTVPGLEVRTALPHGLTVGAAWNRLDPDGEVTMNGNTPAHDVWSGVVAMELDSGGRTSLCPVVRLPRGEWSRTVEGRFLAGTRAETETTTILAAGFGYSLNLPVEGEWVPALFARAEAQRHWETDTEESTGVPTRTDTDTSTEFMSRFGVVLPWERWVGSAWVGMDTFDGRPPIPHAAGDPVFGVSLGVSF